MIYLINLFSFNKYMNILYLLFGFIIILIIRLLLKNRKMYNKCRFAGYRIYDIIANLKIIDSKHEIDKNLWLGDCRAALDNDFLVSKNIKLVVNLSKNLDFTDLDIQKYRVSIHDNRSHESDVGMISHFPNIYNKIEYHLNKGEGVFVHCRAGMQRSASIVALYLMKKYKMNFDSAKNLIRGKRCIAFYPVVNFYGPIKYFESKF